ncbi:MAG TPA: hypothetical protein VE077_17675 [Candidatus Methylomirabilis sp.]|nr:hypothetical protein [Candidatus Methylomirabilis sp.]
MGFPPGFGGCSPDEPNGCSNPIGQPNPGDFGGGGGGGFDPTKLIAQITLLFTNLVIALNKIITNILKALNFVFGRLGKFLLHIWQQYVKKAITWLASHVQKLRAWLKRTIGPIIARLEKIKKWYDTHILKQQLRMLQMLQTVRRFLAILRLLHVKWAAKLDAALVDVQNRIEVSIALVRGTLNQIINTLALVLDPQLLITRNVLGGTLLSNLGAVKRIFGFGDNRILSASEQATIEHQHSLYFTSTVQAHQRTLATSGPTQEDLDNRKAARQALADATGAPLPF